MVPGGPSKEADFHSCRSQRANASSAATRGCGLQTARESPKGHICCAESSFRFGGEIMALSCILSALTAGAALTAVWVAPTAAEEGSVERAADKFSQNEVVQAASGFFGTTTEAVAKAVQRVFAD